jgi:hypothetical protein
MNHTVVVEVVVARMSKGNLVIQRIGHVDWVRDLDKNE